MRLAKLYKTIILIAMVVGPLYWLMITEDGKRRTDTLMLWLTGGDPININFLALDNQYTTDEWQKVFEDIPWQCRDEASSWGDTICFAEISSYNGIPAHYLSAFFVNDYISGLKLVYRNQYHNQLGLELQHQLGKPQLMNTDSEGQVNDKTVLQWQTDGGIVLIKQQLASGEEEAALLWLPKNQ